MGVSISCKNISHTLFRGIVCSQESMKDIDPRSSLWEMESPHSWVSPLVGDRLKRGNSESIGPRAMGKGLAPSCIHFLIIWQTLSTICR